MADNNRGNCKGCRYFGSHQANPSGDEVARCMQPELEDFDLSVSGLSGCSAFEARVGLSREDGRDIRQDMSLDDSAATMH